MFPILIILFVFIVAILLWALFGKSDEKFIEKVSVPLPEQPEIEASKKQMTKDAPARERIADKEAAAHARPEEDDSQFRRREDQEEIEKLKEVDEDFHLPYSADDIIPEGSRYWVFKKTLQNSEIFARKGNFPTAISLYRGVYERIIDQDVNSKIKTNVDYLQEYQKLHIQRKSEALKQKAIDRRGKEIRFSVDGPLSIPDKIQIAVTPPTDRSKEIEEYKNEISDLKKNLEKFDVNKLVDDVVEKMSAKTETPVSKEEIQDDIKNEIDKYKSELEDIKDLLKELRDSKEEEIEEESVEEELLEEKPDEKVSELEDQVKDLIEKNAELPKFKDALLKLHEKLEDLQNRELENLKAPALAEARFQVDASLIKEQPVLEPPPPQQIDFEKDKEEEVAEEEQTESGQLVDEADKEEAQIVAEEAAEAEQAKADEQDEEEKEVTEHVKVEEEEPEEPEEIELLSKQESDENEDELTQLSDEDIFEKILREDIKKKKDDSFEILGYSDKEKDSGTSFLDKEQEEKQLEDERFYRKFLSQGKRVRKELPILKVTYDFSKLPDEFSLSEDQNILQYSFYKYKPMLQKASELIKRKNVRDAINYYNVVKEQNIPPEFKVMLNRNIIELREYIEKYLSSD